MFISHVKPSIFLKCSDEFIIFIAESVASCGTKSNQISFKNFKTFLLFLSSSSAFLAFSTKIFPIF